MSLLHRSSRRYLLRHPWQIGLSVLGVAMAVAVVVGIDLANASAVRAFRLSVEGVAGKATHEIAGGPSGLGEELYARLRLAGFRRTAPVVEGWIGTDRVSTDRAPDRPLRLFGVDPFAEALFRDFTRSPDQGGAAGDLGRFLTLPGAVATTAELAAELGVELDGTFTVTAGGRERELTLVGLLEPGDDLARQSSRDLLVADVSTAQEVLERTGRLDRIDAIVDPGSEEALGALLPSGVVLVAKSSRSGALDQMTRAFRLNLQALSLLALLVGIFLIYNTVTFSVVERRTLIGFLRAMGVTRGEVFSMVLGEVALVALAGTAAGLGLGLVLAGGLLRLVVQTINDLYFVLTVEGVHLSALSWLKGALLGIAGTMAAALVPAREATQAPPRAVMLRSWEERRARGALPRLSAAGLLCGAAAGVLLVLSESLVASFASIFLVVLGCACLVPGLTFAAMRLLAPVMARVFGILGSLAARGVAAALSRTGVAVAALVVAVSMTIGVGIMIRSFRSTLVDWLEVTLQADVYVSPAAGRDAGRTLEPGVVERLSAVPGVASVTTNRRVRVGSPGGPVELMAIRLDRPAFDIYSFTEGRADDVWPRFAAGAAMVSEPFAYHNKVGVGDEVELLTDRGRRSFEVAGVFYNYASDRGIVTLHRDTYDRYWNDPEVDAMGIYAEAGVPPEELIAGLRGTAGRELAVTANRELRRGALEVFDRTFVITGVLRLLAVAVAFIGVLSALMALQLERARELGVLRANGLTPGQVWGLVTTQTGLMGLVSGVLAMPVGVVLASMLVHVINKRSFGWTLRMEVTPGMLLQAVALALVAALLAGIYPSYKMSRSSPAWALREE